VGSKQSQVKVFFDNLQVIHTRGAVLEETHYYPYGMKMAGISAKAFSALNNPYQYQGDYSEFDETTGWNDFYLRSYDAQTGRFNGADPYDQFASPYTGMGNDPVNTVDEDGGWGEGLIGALIGGVAIGTTGYLVAKNQPGISDLEALGIGFGAALLGTGLGYGVDLAFGDEQLDFFQNVKGFYQGLFGSQAGYNYSNRGSIAGNGVTGKVPNIWGNFTMPNFKFGWELTGMVDKMTLLNTIHLMGVSDYNKGRYLIEQVSADLDEQVYSAKGDFIIPPAPENGRSQLEITSSGIQGGNTATLDGNLIKNNSLLLNPKGGKISITVSPNIDIKQQGANYRERQRQINQYGQPFEYHSIIKPNLNFDVKQYGIKTYNQWRFKILGIKTIGRKTL
jgi:RHS repeat-associated protein